MKYLKGLMWLLIMGLLLPFVKDWCDYFTDPATGWMITGPSASYIDSTMPWLIAFVGAIPWLFPFGVLIGIIIMWARPEQPKEPPMGGGRFPRIGGE